MDTLVKEFKSHQENKLLKKIYLKTTTTTQPPTSRSYWEAGMLRIQSEMDV